MAKYFFILGQKNHFFPKKWWHHQKKVIALNLYIGTNVLVYDRCLVLKVWYTAGPTLLPLHTHIADKCESKNHKKMTNQKMEIYTWGNVDDVMEIHNFPLVSLPLHFFGYIRLSHKTML